MTEEKLNNVNAEVEIEIEDTANNDNAEVVNAANPNRTEADNPAADVEIDAEDAENAVNPANEKKEETTEEAEEVAVEEKTEETKADETSTTQTTQISAPNTGFEQVAPVSAAGAAVFAALVVATAIFVKRK